jgi:hypothetical protein
MPWESTRVQRYLTVDFITKRRLNAPAVWLGPQSRAPSPDDAIRPPDTLNTDPHEWALESDERNLAIRLVDGFIELQITAPDDIWNQNLFKAFRILNVDARAAFGSHQISSIIIKIDDPAKIDRWRELWPRGHTDKNGRWVETKFAYSSMPTVRSKAIWHDSKPLPGSIFAQKLVVWRPLGKRAAETAEIGLEDLELRPLAPTTMEAIIRAIAFATLAYWVDIYLDGLEKWDESLTRVIGGWVARLIREGQDINARGKSLEGVCWSPIDDALTAGELLDFLGKLGATKALGVAFLHAERALERNSQAPVPGWSALETLFGPQAKVGIRRAFRAGLDIDAIERMSELYIYDRTMNEYLDRDELLKGLHHEHKGRDLEERHKNEIIFVASKPQNPFKLYAGSSLRTDVQHREFRPGYEPGALLRYSPVHGLLNGEDRHPDEYPVLNTFPGFVIRPVAVIDGAVMTKAVTMLDRMLGLLTQDKDDQIKWLKQFVAFIAQHPEIKPQVCPIIVGGQGIGKSLFGDNLMKALFGIMAGGAAADALTENKFVITPFLSKLITFIDEVRLESVGAINTIKKLVRADYVSGQVKFGHQRDYYVPTRLLIASNQADIGLSPADAADRAFFFIMSWTAENKRMTDREFVDWSVELKPFYADFVQTLEGVVFRQHLMRYFMDFEVTRVELENLQFSSRNDENIVRSTMSKAREVARAIVADARVLNDKDLMAWFNSTNLRDAIFRVDGRRSKVEAGQVMMEFERAGVIEVVRGDIRRFTWGYGKTVQLMGEAHSLPITPNWDYKPGDFDANDIRSTEGAPLWRGYSKSQRQQDRGPYDPDAMGPDYSS